MRIHVVICSRSIWCADACIDEPIVTMLKEWYAFKDGFDMIRKRNLLHSNAARQVSRRTTNEQHSVTCLKGCFSAMNG